MIEFYRGYNISYVTFYKWVSNCSSLFDLVFLFLNTWKLLTFPLHNTPQHAHSPKPKPNQQLVFPLFFFFGCNHNEKSFILNWNLYTFSNIVWLAFITKTLSKFPTIIFANGHINFLLYIEKKNLKKVYIEMWTALKKKKRFFASQCLVVGVCTTLFKSAPRS